MKKEYLKPTMEIVEGESSLLLAMSVFKEEITTDDILAPSLEEELF